MANKYNSPDGPPPSYPSQPPQAHYDAGPAQGQPYYQQGGATQDYYGGQYQQGAGYYGPQGGQYPQQYPQQGYYPPQQGGMYYQQPQGGYYGNQRGRGGEAIATGLCAGLCASLCCLDLCLFF